MSPPLAASLRRRVTPVYQLQHLQSGALVSPGDLAELARDFDQSHALHLPGFLAPQLLTFLQQQLVSTRWEIQIHTDLTPPAVNLKLADQALYGVVLTLMNDPALHRFVEQVSGSPSLGSWRGQLYRMDPTGEHHDAWHNDLDGNRMAAISVNVGRGPFTGGELSMRLAGSQQILWTFANTAPGDAVLFRLRDDLEHYNSDMSGTESKLAIAGWFQKTPNFWATARG